MSFSIKFLGQAVDLCVLLNSAVCREGLQLIPTVIKVRNLYCPSAILCSIADICIYLYISPHKQTNYSKILMLLCLPNTFQAVLFQLKTPHTPTATRVSAWHELYSPLHLLIDTRGLICFPLRTSKLQFSVSSRYAVFTAHHSVHIADLHCDVLLV